MPDGPTAPVTSTPADLALVQPVFDAGSSQFSTKQIQSIAFNEARHRDSCLYEASCPNRKRQLGTLPSTIEDVQFRCTAKVSN